VAKYGAAAGNAVQGTIAKYGTGYVALFSHHPYLPHHLAIYLFRFCLLCVSMLVHLIGAACEYLTSNGDYIILADNKYFLHLVRLSDSDDEESDLGSVSLKVRERRWSRGYFQSPTNRNL
jgi:hypothetical protein